MMAGYYASLHSENVHKLVLYAPLYNFNDHTNLGPCIGSLSVRFGSGEHGTMER